MQDAHPNGTWNAGTHLSADMLFSLRVLNSRFLDLVAQCPSDWGASSRSAAGAVALRVAPLSATQKCAAADCPYALFDLRFDDEAHWRLRLAADPAWTVADDSPVVAGKLEFVRLVLFFAWHVAMASRLAARLFLGMHEATIAAFRGMTIDCIPALAATEALHLAARWTDCTPYWSALTGAATRTDPAELRRIQLYGLQLAAAARLQRPAPLLRERALGV